MLRHTQVASRSRARFAYGALTLCDPAFQPVPLAPRSLYDTPITPARALRHRRFGLFPVRSPLLGESLLLSLPAGTKMFQFPAFASALQLMTGSLPPGCPIRTSADQGVFATTRGFSQLVTSFFASESPGIPHAPLLVPFFLSLSVLINIERTIRSKLVRHVFRLWFARVKLLLCFYSLLASRSDSSEVLIALASSIVNVLFQVVLGRFELPTSTLSV